MEDRECVAFLQWALPRLGMRWRGFRKVRRRVCRRVDRRIRELGLPDVAAYRVRLEEGAVEWRVLDTLCTVTISRFCRDRSAFAALVGEVLPQLAEGASSRGEHAVRCWSAGCACGEEPYTLTILWRTRVPAIAPGIEVRVLGTDVDAAVLERARRGIYPHSSVREVPMPLREVAFERIGPDYRVRDRFREQVTFERTDVRSDSPDGPFDLVLCRNLAFTYFDAEQQRRVLGRFAASLRPGGALMVGCHEQLPGDGGGPFEPWLPRAGIHRRRSGA